MYQINMKTKRFENKDIGMDFVSDFGMTLEMYVKSKSGQIERSVGYPLFKIYADEKTEKLYMEIESEGKLVQVPVSSIMKMIEAAKVDVHSDNWFDEHVFNQKDT